MSMNIRFSFDIFEKDKKCVLFSFPQLLYTGLDEVLRS